MNARAEFAATVALVCVAALAAGALVFDRAGAARGTPKLLDGNGWAELLAHGLAVGDSTAPVKIVEFGDFQCPACRQFHQSARAVLHDRPGRVQLIFIHSPLRKHEYARPTAIAAECAALQGRFLPFADAIFRDQGALGSRPLTSFSREAGVEDLAKFSLCLSRPEARARVERAARISETLGIRATPTILINGRRYPPLDARALTAIVDELVEESGTRRASPSGL